MDALHTGSSTWFMCSDGEADAQQRCSTTDRGRHMACVSASAAPSCVLCLRPAAGVSASAAVICLVSSTCGWCLRLRCRHMCLVSSPSAAVTCLASPPPTPSHMSCVSASAAVTCLASPPRSRVSCLRLRGLHVSCVSASWRPSGIWFVRSFISASAPYTPVLMIDRGARRKRKYLWCQVHGDSHYPIPYGFKRVTSGRPPKQPCTEGARTRPPRRPHVRRLRLPLWRRWEV